MLYESQIVVSRAFTYGQIVTSQFYFFIFLNVLNKNHPYKLIIKIEDLICRNQNSLESNFGPYTVVARLA